MPNMIKPFWKVQSTLISVYIHSCVYMYIFIHIFIYIYAELSEVESCIYIFLINVLSTATEGRALCQ